MMRDAVRSVIAQSDPNWRLTVVDDGNADGVPEWFAGLGDDRVRYLRNERNLGVTGNFNRCLDLVEHELVMLMGCDDLMLPNYVATVLAVHRDVPTADIIHFLSCRMLLTRRRQPPSTFRRTFRHFAGDL